MRVDRIPLTTIDGEATTLAELPGRVHLVVNVASRCGFARQYAGLERLWQDNRERGLTVVGFPSNQFLQELSDDDAVKEYCSTTFGVTFPLMRRVRVNGRSRHPLFAALSEVPDADGRAGRVRWNFEKFVVAPDGGISRHRSAVEPDAPELLARVEAALAA